MASCERAAAHVPTLPLTCTASEFAAAYSRTRAVLLRGDKRAQKATMDLEGLRALLPVHKELKSETTASYTVENAPIDTSSGAKKRKRASNVGTQALEYLLGSPTTPSGAWYASCVVQHHPDALLAKLPLVTPCCLDGESAKHSRAIWLFVGLNDTAAPLSGRPEHTDNVRHDGTWHFQAEGCKEWRLRPTDELLKKCPAVGGPSACTVVCEAGDVLVVSTRDWWHATSLPPQPHRSHVSFSYAREFNWLRAGASSSVAACSDILGAVDRDGNDGSDGGDGDDDDELHMTNSDGLAAACAISAGGLVLREEEMPSVSLPYSVDHNVRVVYDPLSGERVLVATKDLRSGEALILPLESDEGASLEVAGVNGGEDGGEEGDGVEEEGEEEEEEEGEGEEEAVVQCDRRDCRRELSNSSEVVYTNSLGQDYCEACAAKFSEERRTRMRRLTVAERLAEAEADEEQ